MNYSLCVCLNAKGFRREWQQVDVLCGSLSVGLDLSSFVQNLTKKSGWELLGRYDIIGEVVMLSGGSPTAFVRGDPPGGPAQAQSSLKELLGEVLAWGPKLLAEP